MFSKCGKYFVFIFLFLFLFILIADVADAFTAVRPEQLKERGGSGPMTRAQRKARKRRAEEQQGNIQPVETPSSEPTFIHDEPNNGDSSLSGMSKAEMDRQPTETPTIDPLAEQQKEIEKRKEATKRSNIIAGIIFFLIIAGVAGWYFTRNMNFKNLKK